jgi:CheY-like chemotaxis protein
MRRPRHVLVVDDDAFFVEALVSAFEAAQIRATGCSDPAQVMKWSKRDDFAFDLILLDMRLGPASGGQPDLHATMLLPHLMTYAPSAKVVIFSQHNVTVKECIACISLGALTVVPKSVSRVEELCLIGEVYDELGSAERAQQDLLEVLWDDLSRDGGDPKGERLEMLVINIFKSMPTFAVIGHDVPAGIGKIDVLVQNRNRHEFWRLLESFELVIECKNERRPPEPDVFSQVATLVKTRGAKSKTGIVVSMSNFTGTFQNHQNASKTLHDVNLLGLGREHLERVVGLRPDEREAYLRSVLQRQ